MAELHAVLFLLCAWQRLLIGAGVTWGVAVVLAHRVSHTRGFWRPQVGAFMGELGRFDTHGTLCTTPLLLNLMLREYMRHEAKDSAIQFDGDTTLLPHWQACGTFRGGEGTAF